MNRQDIEKYADRVVFRGRVSRAGLGTLIVVFWLGGFLFRLGGDGFWQFGAIGNLVLVLGLSLIAELFVGAPRMRHLRGGCLVARMSAPKVAINAGSCLVIAAICLLFVGMIADGYRLESRREGQEGFVAVIMIVCGAMFAGVGVTKVVMLLRGEDVLLVDRSGYLDRRSMSTAIPWQAITRLRVVRHRGGSSIMLKTEGPVQPSHRLQLFSSAPRMGNDYTLSALDLDCNKGDILLAIADHAPHLIEGFDPKARDGAD